MKKLIASLAGLSLFAGALGFAPATADASTLSGFICESSHSVDYIQLTMSGDEILGSWQEVSVDSWGNLNTAHYNLHGIRNGSSLALDVQGFGEIDGRLSKNTLTVSIPQSDGSLAAVTFKPGTSALYNKDVAAFRKRVITAANVQEDEAQIDTDAQQLQQDKAALTEDLPTLSDAVNDANSTVAEMPQLVSTVQQDEQKVLQDVQSGMYPTSDMDHLSDDYDFLDTKYQMGIEQDDVGAVSSNQTDLKTYESDYATLLSDSSKVPSYRPSPSIPAKSSEATFVKATQKSIDSANTNIDNAAAKALSFVQQGKQYFNEAYSAAQSVQK